DPLLGTAQRLIDGGAASADGVAGEFAAIGDDVATAAERAMGLPQLRARAEISSPLAPRHSGNVAAQVMSSAESAEAGTPLTVAAAINRALADELAERPEMLVFGEDVGRKGGVY